MYSIIDLDPEESLRSARGHLKDAADFERQAANSKTGDQRMRLMELAKMHGIMATIHTADALGETP